MPAVQAKALSPNALFVVKLDSPRHAAPRPLRGAPCGVAAAQADAMGEPGTALTPYLSKYGLAAVLTNPALAKPFLTTEYAVPLGKPTDQKQSGRCWIFSGLNMLRQRMQQTYGPEFQYSQNYVAYWDKFERANAYLTKMIELADEPIEGQRLLNLVEHLYSDGGEFEFFRNVVLQHGLVPDYAMPETDMAGLSDSYMTLLRRRVQEIGGLLHKHAKAGVPADQLEEIKQTGLGEVRTILNAFLGRPPQHFLWREPVAKKKGAPTPALDITHKTPAGSSIQRMTPLELLAKNPCKLDDMVHVTNFPNHPYDVHLRVQDVNNLATGETGGLQGLNVAMDELDAVRGRRSRLRML